MMPIWDTHAHVIDHRYPFADGRDYTPDPASLEDYLAMLDRNGIERGVLVQPSFYGFDNRCLLDALDRADGRLVGVIVPEPETPARELKALHARGVRGVRCNIVNSGGLRPEAALQWQPALRELGWHVAFQIVVDDIPDLRAFLDPFTVPIVIDHMGRPRNPDPAAPPVPQLIELVRDGACYVKLSAPYRFSRAAPPWPDVTPLARALVSANPAACMWATDWPHTDVVQPIHEDDLHRALDASCADSATRATILETTPQSLFGA
jgi:2-pyrone-4,6-dicarboxylate lactonase